MRHDFGYFEEDKLPPVGDVGLWRRILGYVVPYWHGVAAAVFLSLIISGSALMLPYLVRLGVDNYVVNQDPEVTARFQGLAELVLPFAGLVILGFIANFLQVMLLEWTGQNVMHTLRQHLFSHIIGLDLKFFNRNPIGKLVTRLTNDIQNMHEMFTSVIVTLFNDLLRVAGILVVLFFMNWRLALLISLLVPLIILNTIWFSRLARNAFRQIRTSLARLNSFLQEIISGISIIQLFMREKDTNARFIELNRAYFAGSMYQIKIFGIFMPFLEVLSSLAMGLIIWYGGGEIIRERMTLGVLVAFLYYVRLFFQPLRELSQKYSIVQSAMASAERIFQLLDTESSLAVAALPVALGPAANAGAIEFKQVTFGYDAEQEIIRDFSLAVSPGETLAVVGATGAGKTTIINLLERFYDPDQGEIRLDGIDLRDLDPRQLRQRVGLVMQDVYIVPATVRENILLDREMAEEELQRIIAESQLAGVVARLPDGLETRIGEGGIELSAGQKQLLSLARVLARNPQVLVLDEATSNVDTETEMLIERALEITLASRTSIVIAHRLSTIRRADRIIVMAHGRIAEQGTHDHLMARPAGLYRCLQELQINGTGTCVE